MNGDGGIEEVTKKWREGKRNQGAEKQKLAEKVEFSCSVQSGFSASFLLRHSQTLPAHLYKLYITITAMEMMNLETDI